MKSKKYASVDKAQCVACGACINECPRDAIEIWAGSNAIVNTDVCIGCGKCVAICPAGSITVLAREDKDE